MKETRTKPRVCLCLVLVLVKKEKQQAEKKHITVASLHMALATLGHEIIGTTWFRLYLC